MDYKKIFIFAAILVFVITAGFFGYRYMNSSKDYIAVVNGERASSKEFKFILSSVKARMEQEYNITDFSKSFGDKKAIDFAKEQALESIVNYKLELQKAKEMKIVLAESEIKEISDNAQNIATQNTKLMEMLNSVGMNLADFKQMNINFGIINKLREQTHKDYYEKNKEKYVAQEEMVRARHILIKTLDENNNELSADKVEEMRKKAESILNRIKSGEDFVSLVNEYSEDTGSVKSGGEYTFKKGDMVEEFEKAAYSLKPGEVSGLVKTKFGFHIIKLEEKLPVGTQLKYEAAEQKVIQDLNYENILEEWKKQSQISKNEQIYNSIQ